MRIGALYLLDGDAVAAWHWPWSITWRWLLCVSRRSVDGRWGVFQVRIYQGRHRIVLVKTPWVVFRFQSQPNMRRRRCFEVA